MQKQLLLIKRSLLFFLATFLLLLGIASLFLPILPGIIIILISFNLFLKISQRFVAIKDYCKKVIEKTNLAFLK